jgi:hypothetical protein
MLVFRLQIVFWLSDVSEKEVTKAKQSLSGPRQRPDPVPIVQLAKEAQSAPLLLDLVGGQFGRRGLLDHRSAPIQEETNREQYCDEC